jgi:hypothetical protein
MHTNLFSAGHTKAEVYEALVEHQHRDARHMSWWAFASAVALLVAIQKHGLVRDVAALACLTSAASSLRVFIDQSNRRFFLHLIDWMNAPK